jgi:hypothetical protein
LGVGGAGEAAREVPEDGFAVEGEGLVLGVGGECLRGGGAAGGPAQEERSIAPGEGRVRGLAEGLRVGERAEGKVQLTEERLGGGIDSIALGGSEVGVFGGEMGWGGAGEVGGSDGAEVGRQGGDMGILRGFST